MRNAILRELMTEYEQLRAANTREELRRREEVSRRCPEIAAILEQRQQLIFQGVRNVLDGQGSAENLPQQMEVLTARLEHLLQENGYPATYLDRSTVAPGARIRAMWGKRCETCATA